MQSEAVYEDAKALLAAGLGPTEVARILGLPRSTVKTWGRRPRRRQKVSLADLADWRPPDPAACLDAIYERVIDEADAAIASTLPGTSVRRFRRRTRAVVVQASHAVWPIAFPQHGPGPKHLRPIKLEPWQRDELTHAHPRELIRGLIHSDGCRCVNRFSTELPSGRVGRYAYVRYFFSNLSEDIKEIFCEHADLLGIRWSRATRGTCRSPTARASPFSILRRAQDLT